MDIQVIHHENKGIEIQAIKQRKVIISNFYSKKEIEEDLKLHEVPYLYINRLAQNINTSNHCFTFKVNPGKVMNAIHAVHQSIVLLGLNK